MSIIQNLYNFPMSKRSEVELDISQTVTINYYNFSNDQQIFLKVYFKVWKEADFCEGIELAL